MAEHQRPEEDLTVKVAEASPGEPGNVRTHTGWERTAKITMKAKFNTMGPAFNTADTSHAHVFEPYPMNEGFGTWLSYQHVTPWNNNFIYLCAHRNNKYWKPHSTLAASITNDNKIWEEGMPLGVQSLFQQFTYYRVSKIWYTMSNVMLVDVRPTSADAQESTTQVIDDIKFLQQQRNIEICRLIGRQEFFGTDTIYGWTAPLAADLQRHPMVQIDALNALHGFTYTWEPKSGEGWKQTLYPGATKPSTGQILNDPRDPNKWKVDKRLDRLYEWYNSYNLPVCNAGHPQSHFTLIAPRMNQYHHFPDDYQKYLVKKWRGSRFATWNHEVRWLSGNDHSQYFHTTSPNQMFWCLNVEGLLNSHFIQTYYRMDVGCELEFCDPMLGYTGVSQQFGMNRSYRVQKQGRFETHSNPYAYDVVNCQHYVYGPKEYFTQWPTFETTPCQYEWPPNTKPNAHPILCSQRERTVKGLPLSYISEDDRLITPLDEDDLGEGNEGYISDRFIGGADVEMTPPHNFAPPSSSADHDGQADLVPVSDDEYILSIVN